jgi:hypothetical protein
VHAGNNLSIIAGRLAWVEDRVVEGWLSRRWLSGLGLAFLVMMVGALPWDGADAAPAMQAASTPTIAAVWTVTDPRQGHKVLVDPFGQRFEFVPARGTPESAHVPTMRYTRQTTTWKWQDTNRPCVATPVPPSSRVARCPVFVWGSIDRVRHYARATLFKRNPNGTTSVYTIDQRLTPLPLPMPDEPAVELQGGRFSPGSKTLPDDTARVTFQNNSQQDCTIQFDSDPNGSLADPNARPGDPPLPQETERILRGRASTPFPPLRPTPVLGPGQQPKPPPTLWLPGTYRYRCKESPGFSGLIVIRKAS